MELLISIALLVIAYAVIKIPDEISEKREIAKLETQVEEKTKRILDLCKELEE